MATVLQLVLSQGNDKLWQALAGVVDDVDEAEEEAVNKKVNEEEARQQKREAEEVRKRKEKHGREASQSKGGGRERSQSKGGGGGGPLLIMCQ